MICQEIYTQKKLEQKVDSLEQQAKKKNIQLMGIEESDNETVLAQVRELFVNKLKVRINDEIVSAYRVGKNYNGCPRHLVVASNGVNMKNIIYRKKKLLKGSGIVIKEDLTVERLKLVKEASNKYDFKNVWTFNGVIFIKSENVVEKITYNA
ncbi:hypothetical protein JTB14_017421 [Gonioctena quinquepunctata]|nr:hypothetical protein JTB14_017421 [Gonioctena quinquepunctata]